MKNKTIQFVIFLFCILPLSGCVFISHNHSGAEGINNAEQIVIIKSLSTREGFLNAIKEWMTRNNYKYSVIESGESNLSDYEGALDYKGTWRWDFTIFLDDAEIRAFKNGQEIGNAKYNVGIKGGYNLSKWRSAEKTIFRMLDNLFGKK